VNEAQADGDSDLADARSDDFGRRKAVADHIRHACLTAGFFYGKLLRSPCLGLELMIVKNHGVPAPIVEKTFDQSQQFFDTSVEVKKSVSFVTLTDSDQAHVSRLISQNPPISEGTWAS
jgi:isopenicillin N synthase-like dioxygenase